MFSYTLENSYPILASLFSRALCFPFPVASVPTYLEILILGLI